MSPTGPDMDRSNPLHIVLYGELKDVGGMPGEA